MLYSAYNNDFGFRPYEDGQHTQHYIMQEQSAITRADIVNMVEEEKAH